MKLSHRETKTGPPPQVGLHTPVIILGQKNLMITAAERDSITSGGSAYSAKYTEGSEVSRTGPMLRGNIPALHAMGSSDSDDEDAGEGNRRERTKKLVKAHLLNEATLGELELWN